MDKTSRNKAIKDLRNQGSSLKEIAEKFNLSVSRVGQIVNEDYKSLNKRIDDLKLRKNSEGYSDPTAYQAIKNVDGEADRFHKLLNTIFNICDLSGFKVEGRITLKDKRSGRVWK